MIKDPNSAPFEYRKWPKYRFEKKMKDDTWEAKMQMQMFSHFKISASSWSILTFSLSLKNPIFSLLKWLQNSSWKLKFI